MCAQGHERWMPRRLSHVLAEATVSTAEHQDMRVAEAGRTCPISPGAWSSCWEAPRSALQKPRFARGYWALPRT